MKLRWLGIAIIVLWLAQVAFLWPLPSQLAAEMVARTPEMKSVIGDYEQTLWLGWLSRLLLIAFGVTSGVAILRQNPKWPARYLAMAVAYVAVFQPWQWIPLLMHGLWRRPELFFNTIFFPIFIATVAVYAAYRHGAMRKGSNAV